LNRKTTIKILIYFRVKANGYPLAVMPRVAGPIIASQGGWFVNFNDGMSVIMNYKHKI
jgi:hypothetical protein